jgi:PEP-CTERM motif
MRYLHSVASAGVIALAATASPAVANVVTTPTYIAVPSDAANVQPGGAFSAFDISFASAATGDVYIADRSNAAVDIFSGTSLSLIGRATGFTGQQATTSISGPDGVLTVTSGGTTTLYAGDGNSTLRVFNATSPAAPTLLQAIPTGGSLTSPCGPTISCRVDEMAYSPTAQRLLAANNADAPAFGNLFSTTGPTNAPATLLTTPGVGIQIPASMGGITGGGMEQSAWNPQTTVMGGASFWVSIPALAGTNNPGGVAQISTAGTVLQTINFANIPGISSGGCSPAGLAVSASGNMLVGCGNVGTQAVLLDRNGNFLKFVGAGSLGGTDEIWYDPTTNEFYVTGNGGTNTTRFFDIVDANGNVIQTVDLPDTTSAHSIAVDPLNGDVFVALAGTFGPTGIDPCPATQANPGCIAIFAQAVPEPGSLPVLVVGLAGLIGLAVRRRFQ